MKKQSICICVICTILISPLALGARVLRGCGGDGPKPLVQTDHHKLMEWIPAGGGVFEFGLSKHGSELIYRNTSADVFSMNLLGGDRQWLASFPVPMSQVMDHHTRYITAKDEPTLYDIITRRWHHYSSDPHKPLFWHHGTLYSAMLNDNATTTIGSYSPYQEVYRTRCVLRGQKLVSGHHAPSLFTYSTTKLQDGIHLAIHEIDVRNCTELSVIDFTEPLNAVVKGVYWFSGIEAIAVTFEASTEASTKLLWVSDLARCKYLDVGINLIFPITDRFPVMASWSSDSGLRILYPEDEKQELLLSSWKIHPINPDDVVMLQRNTVFVAPQFMHRASKSLLRISME